MLGFIIMAGIVVNSAILLVEQALNHMQEGMATAGCHHRECPQSPPTDFHDRQ